MPQVDPGREFMGSVTKEMENHTKPLFVATALKFTETKLEHFNRMLAERLLGHQYAVEMPESQRSTSWVKRLPDVVAALKMR